MIEAMIVSIAIKKEVLIMNIKHSISKILPDSVYLKIKFKRIRGRPLNLKNPKFFYDKLQWLKLHDHNPVYISLVDKFEVKKIIADMLGNEYIIPTLGVWNSFDEIDFNQLPDRFVLKCTHDSGGVVICKNKNKFDFTKAGEKINEHLKHNYYWTGREWPYKHIPHKIIAEQYMEDEKTGSLDDYKLFCFDGVVDNIMVVRGRANGKPKYYHFDKDWNLCRFNRLTRALPLDFCEEKPPFIDRMIEIAEIISKGFPHVRIDLYEANGCIYFGEFTLYNQSGWETGFDEYSDSYLGSLIHLPGERE